VTGKLRLFISSVQQEFAADRRALRDFVDGDALLRRFFSVFLFEDLPASDRHVGGVYLGEVDRCDIYIGLFGREWGAPKNGAVSPTAQEFDRATAKGKIRLIFVKGSDDKGRHPQMPNLIRHAGAQLIRRRFKDVPDLTTALYASLVEHLERTGRLRSLPFDAAACLRATMRDIDDKRIEWFLRTARRERRFSLKQTATPVEILTHLNLLDGRRPSNAAILLFGRNPQHYLPVAEVKCLHFHGTEIKKPIPSYQLFKGTLFEQVDQAVDFVLAKVARTVAARDRGPETAVKYELPKPAISEAIVNAVAHRDYTSNAGVQVMLFADRLEVWNPGELPPSLTPEDLRSAHSSIPRNPLIADPLFLAHYIEKAGTGTLDMIAACVAAGLPEPAFEQRGGQFVTILWRDWMTESILADLGLSARHIDVVNRVRMKGRINNAEYREVYGVSKPTATRDLDHLRLKQILIKVGRTGRGTYYVLNPKGITKGSMDSRLRKGS